jgi:hypothetical protein
MATRMQQRRGTSADWTSANPILAPGEIGFETDSGQFKIGDGINRWEDLSYFRNLEDLGFNAEDYVEVTLLGQPDGVATLDADGKLEPSQIPNIDEISQDAINAALTAGSGISKEYDDNANTLTLSVDTDLVATKTYVDDAVASLVGGAPDLLNTLNELAAAINDDESFSETVINTINDSIDEANNTLAGIIAEDISDSAQATLTSANEYTTGAINTLVTDTISPLSTTVNALSDSFDTLSDELDDLSNDVSNLESGKQDVVAGVTSDEIAYLSNVTSDIQSQIDSKSSFDHTHELADITDVTATATEVNFLSGVTSGIQSQLNAKSESGHTHNLADIDDVTASASELNILDGAIVTTEELNLLSGTVITTLELDHLAGVTAAVQTQLDGKADESHTHSLVDVTDVTATATEVNYLSGADSNIQDQLDGKAASSHSHAVSDLTGVIVDATAINSLSGVQSNVQDQLNGKSDDSHTHLLEDVTDVTATTAEVNYLSGVTSSVQDQLDSISEDVTDISSSLSGKQDVVAGVDSTKIGYLSGVTSGIQSQLDGKSAVGHTHTTADIDGLSATATELNHSVGVTSSIQTQLDGKALASHTHPQSDITDLEDDLASKASLSGATFTGTVVLHADPTQAMHASTKQYVDNVASGILAKPSVVAATTANLDATYDNGTSGAGATLTATSNGAFPQIDGVSVTTVSGQRGVLVKNQSNSSENGRYNLTTQGDANTPWVLTRCGLCDTSDEIPGAYVFVTDGTVNGQTGWVQHVDDPATFTVGTDDIDVFQFAGSGAVTAGTNVEVTGNQVSVVDDPEFSDIVVTGSVDLTGANVTGIALGSGGVDDVTVSAPTSQDVLYFNGLGWVNKYINAIPVKLSNATVTSDNYELVAADAGKIVEISNANATTVTIPSDESFAIGTMIVVSQTGAGQVTVVVESPAVQTLNSTPGSKLRAQWSVATLLKRSANTWLVYGDLVA